MTDLWRPRSPGWYPDPEDPTRLRQWDGDAWNGRHRLRPAWSVSSVDFVPSLTTADDSRSAPRRLVRHGTVPRAAVGSRRHPPPDRSADLRDPAPDPWASGAKARRYHPLTGFAVFLAVAAVILSLTAGLSRPQGPFSTVNTAFATKADTACTTSLTAVHTTEGTAAGGSRVDAARADLAAARVDRLASQIGSWPETRGAGPGVWEWLERWHRYASQRHHYASLLRDSAPSASHPAADPAKERKAEEAAGQATSDASQADEFALANGLQACTLLTRSASPALITVP